MQTPCPAILWFPFLLIPSNLIPCSPDPLSSLLSPVFSILSSAQTSYPALLAACALAPCVLPPFVSLWPTSIMQNKPNFQNPKITATSCVRRIYRNIPPRPTPGKQTQSNPIPSPQQSSIEHRASGVSPPIRSPQYACPLGENNPLTVQAP